jgi:transcriptional regulator
VVYLPPVFSESRPDVLVAHIERHPFGMLISHGETGIETSRLPFLVECEPVSAPSGTPLESSSSAAGSVALRLKGHLARANPQVPQLAAGGEVLAVFTGPHAYVSPTWYQAGPSVPTWNYADVHAYGTVRLIAEATWLDGLLRRLSERHEAGNAAPWRMEDQPADYLAAMLEGIIGFEIAVTRLEGKFKLSQNRPPADRPRIIAALEGRGDDDARAVARLMRTP